MFCRHCGVKFTRRYVCQSASCAHERGRLAMKARVEAQRLGQERRRKRFASPEYRSRVVDAVRKRLTREGA